MNETAISEALPGSRFTLTSGPREGTWLRLEDADPPYIEGTWVEINTGKVCPHWSYLWEELKAQLEREK